VDRGDPEGGTSEVADAGPDVDEHVAVRSIRGVQMADSAPSIPMTDAFQLMQELFANLGRGSGAVVISAAAGNEFAFEGPDTNNGVFTHSVIEAIESTSAESYLRLSQLREFVVSRVRTLTHGLQTPSIRRVNLDFDYAVFSENEPVLTDVPRVESRDFGQLLLQAAEQNIAGQ